MLRALAPFLVAVFAGLAPSLCGQDTAAPAPDLEVVRSLDLPAGVVSAAAFAPSGGLLCSGGEAGDVIVWDVRTGTQRWRAQVSDRRIAAVAWPLAGDRVAVLGRDLTVHDVRDGRELMRTEAWADASPAMNNAGALAYSPDGQQLAFQRSRSQGGGVRGAARATAVRVVGLPAGNVVADIDYLLFPIIGLA